MALFENLGRTMTGPADTLKIECGCGHRAVWSRQAAFARLGAGSTPSDVRRRLKCTSCSGKSYVRVWI
jgi:hypothetical protein